jgi:hypothetical protein
MRFTFIPAMLLLAAVTAHAGATGDVSSVDNAGDSSTNAKVMDAYRGTSTARGTTGVGVSGGGHLTGKVQDTSSASVETFGGKLEAFISGSGTSPSAIGSDAHARNSGTGDVPVIIGSRGWAEATGAGDTDVLGAFDGLLTHSGAGDVDLAYGLRLPDVAGLGTTSWAIMSYGGNSFHVGSMTLGSTDPPTAGAILDLDTVLGAFLPPRLTTTQRDALTAAEGMQVYNTTTDQMEVYALGSWVSMGGAGGGITGSGTDKHLMRWNGTSAAQDSDVVEAVPGELVLEDGYFAVGNYIGFPLTVYNDPAYIARFAIANEESGNATAGKSIGIDAYTWNDSPLSTGRISYGGNFWAGLDGVAGEAYSGNMFGGQFGAQQAVDGTFTADLRGIYAYARLAGAAVNTNGGGIAGVTAGLDVADTSSTLVAAGLITGVQIGATAYVGNLRHLWLTENIISGATVTEQYGLYMEALQGATNNYVFGFTSPGGGILKTAVPSTASNTLVTWPSGTGTLALTSDIAALSSVYQPLDTQLTSLAALTYSGNGSKAVRLNSGATDFEFYTPTTGTVTSVAVSGANGIGVSGSPVTSTGTIALSLGAITPTSVNGNTITTGTGVLTLGAGKTFTASNTLTLTGTDGSTLNVGTGGTLGTAAYTAASAYEVPLTFSTGLTRSTNTITVNTTQNLLKDSALTTNGIVTTSGSDGTLGVTVPGTGVLTALGVNIGSAGAPVLFNAALGTPLSGVATNLTGTAAGLTAGNVTTNANLTGPITSVGNATSIASQTGAGTKFVMDTSPTLVTPTWTGRAAGDTLGLGGASTVVLDVTGTSASLTDINGSTREAISRTKLSSTSPAAAGGVGLWEYELDPSANTAALLSSGVFLTTVKAGNAKDLSGSTRGIRVSVLHSGTGTVTNLIGTLSDATAGSAGLVTNLYGVQGGATASSTGNVSLMRGGNFSATNSGSGTNGTVTGVFGQGLLSSTATSTELRGVHGIGNTSGSGNVSLVHGGFLLGENTGTGTNDNIWGVQGQATMTSTGTTTNLVGVEGKVTNTAGGTVSYAAVCLHAIPPVGRTSGAPNSVWTGVYGVAIDDMNPSGASNTVGTTYGIHITDQTAADAWGIYSDYAGKSALKGNLRLGGVTAPTVPLDVTGNALISGTLGVTGALSLTTALTVPNGGTGVATHTTAYGLLAAGTTATGAEQTLPAGATTEILVGGGASALPVWTTAQGSGAPVRATSPTLTTPNMGAAIGTSLDLSAGGGSISLAQASNLWLGGSGTGSRIRQNVSGNMVLSRGGTDYLVLTAGALSPNAAGSTDLGTIAKGYGVQYLAELAANPSSPTSNTELAAYMKADKFVIQFNNGGTVRYFTLDLTQSGATPTWAQSTSAP